MTGQQPDELVLAETPWQLLATPLDRRLAELGLQFDAPHTGNFRGYVASWEVRDKRLWLTKLHAWRWVNEPVRGLRGLITLGRNVQRAQLSECRGLVFADPQSGGVPGGAGSGLWFVDREERTAVLVPDGRLAQGIAQTREGFFLCGTRKLELRKAAVLHRALIVPAADLTGYFVEVPPHARPATEHWLPMPDPVWHARSAAEPTLTRVSDLSWVRTGPPPWPPNGPAPDPGPPSWPVEQLSIHRRVLVEQDLTALGAAELPIFAHFVTGTLRAGSGRIEQYIHAGFESRWEREVLIEIDGGVVKTMRPLRGRLDGDSPTFAVEVFFDLGAGTMLWAANDATADIWDYAIYPDELPITADCAVRLGELVAEYDRQEPSDIGGAQSSTPEWRADFARRYRSALDGLRDELGAGFTVDDQERQFGAPIEQRSEHVILDDELLAVVRPDADGRTAELSLYWRTEPLAPGAPLGPAAAVYVAGWHRHASWSVCRADAWLGDRATSPDASRRAAFTASVDVAAVSTYLDLFVRLPRRRDRTPPGDLVWRGHRDAGGRVVIERIEPVWFRGVGELPVRRGVETTLLPPPEFTAPYPTQPYPLPALDRPRPAESPGDPAWLILDGWHTLPSGRRVEIAARSSYDETDGGVLIGLDSHLVVLVELERRSENATLSLWWRRVDQARDAWPDREAAVWLDDSPAPRLVIVPALTDVHEPTWAGSDEYDTQFRTSVPLPQVERYVDLLSGLPFERPTTEPTDTLIWRGGLDGAGHALIDLFQVDGVPNGADAADFPVVATIDVGFPARVG